MQTVVKNVVQMITESLTRFATILKIAPLAKIQVALLVAKITMAYEFSKQVLGNSGSATTNHVKHNTGTNVSRSDATTAWYTLGAMRASSVSPTVAPKEDSPKGSQEK